MRSASMALPLLVLLGACGGSAAVSAPPVATPVATPATAQPLDPHALARSAVHAAVADGLGVFLQHVELDEQPVMASGKFHGFRISALRGDDYWAGVDLKPGDVVTGINGMPIERPEQAQSVLDSLDSARELRVSFEREGQAHELVYAIVDGR